MVGKGRGERREEEREKTREGEVRKIIEDMRRRRNDVEMCGLASWHMPPCLIRWGPVKRAREGKGKKGEQQARREQVT